MSEYAASTRLGGPSILHGELSIDVNGDYSLRRALGVFERPAINDPLRTEKNEIGLRSDLEYAAIRETKL